MPTITIKNGNRTLKLSKREWDVLQSAARIAKDIEGDFDELRESANYAKEGLRSILKFVVESANGKPAPPASPADGKGKE